MRVCLCLSVHGLRVLVLIYSGLILKENELERKRVRVMFSPYQQIDDVCAASHLHWGLLSVLPALLCSFKVVCARRWKRRHEEQPREEKTVYVAVYTDGTSHSRVCPGFDIAQPCCRSRANRGCLKEEVDCASVSECFGKDCDSRRALNVLKSVPLYLQRHLCCLPVAERFSLFVYLEHVGTRYAPRTSRRLIINPTFFYFCGLYYKRQRHTEACMSVCTHAYNCVCVSPSKLPHLKSSCIKGSCLSSHFISVIFFLAYFFLPLSLHTFSFFFYSVPCAFPSLFPTYSFSHPCLSLLDFPVRKILQRKVMFFFLLFYIHVPFLQSSLLLKCSLKGAISQVLLCPPYCKTLSHPHPIHQTGSSQPHRLLPHFS